MGFFLTAAALIFTIILVILALHIFVIPVRIISRFRTSGDEIFTVNAIWGVVRARIILSRRGVAEIYLYQFMVKDIPLGEIRGQGEEGTEEEERLNPAVMRTIFEQILSVAGEIGFDYLRVDMKVGTGDPCMTGMIFGFASALEGVMNASGRFNIHVIPVFETEAFELDSEAGIRVRNLYRIIIIIIRIFRLSKNESKKSAGGTLPA